MLYMYVKKKANEQAQAIQAVPGLHVRLIHSEEGLKEAENMISKVLEELSGPVSAGTTCTPAVLEQRIGMCLEAIDNSVSNFSVYNEDSTGTYVYRDPLHA